MNEEYHTERIEQYLSGRLTGESLRAFEEKMRLDASFKREVDNQRNIVRNIQLAGREDLRGQLRQFHREAVAQEARLEVTRPVSGSRQRRLFPYYAVAASVVLVIIAGIWLYTTQFRNQLDTSIAASPTPPQRTYIPYQVQNPDTNLGFASEPAADTTIAILIYPGRSSGPVQYQFDDTLRLYGTVDTRNLSLQYDQSAERYELQTDSTSYPLNRYAAKAPLQPGENRR